MIAGTGVAIFQLWGRASEPYDDGTLRPARGAGKEKGCGNAGGAVPASVNRLRLYCPPDAPTLFPIPSIAMLEDPTLTRDVLAYFARDEVGYPAQVTLEELQRAFNDVTPDKLAYHTKLAIDLELLDGRYKTVPFYGGQEELIFVSLSGLTRQGSDYVKMARTPQWRKACEELKQMGRAVSTAVLVQVLSGTVSPSG